MSGYDPAYYARMRDTPNFARHLTEFGKRLWDVYRPKRVLDVGAGLGHVLAGMREVAPSSFSCSAIENPSARVILEAMTALPPESYVWADLEFFLGEVAETVPPHVPMPPPSRPYDMVICMELGEHLSPRCAPGLVEYLTRLSKLVVWSAAGPDQPEETHLNLQPPGYWAAEFAYRGFVYGAPPASLGLDGDGRVEGRWIHLYRRES